MNDMNNNNNQQQVVMVGDKSGWGVASLVFGIIALVTCSWSIIPPILSIIFALVAKSPITHKMHGTAKAGLICTFISLLPCIILIIAVAVGGVGCLGAGCAAMGSM